MEMEMHLKKKVAAMLLLPKLANLIRNRAEYPERWELVEIGKFLKVINQNNNKPKLTCANHRYDGKEREEVVAHTSADLLALLFSRLVGNIHTEHRESVLIAVLEDLMKLLRLN